MSHTFDILAIASFEAGGDRFTDAVARASDGTRVFVPGFLPCGECPLCRRGLVGACPAAQRPPLSPGARLELPTRYLTPLDDLPDLSPLSDAEAAKAGAIAFALHALAVANTLPGDLTVWLGPAPLAAHGATVAETQGARALHSADFTAAATEALAAALATTPDAAPTHGTTKRLFFLAEASAASWRAAITLAEPGSTFVGLGPAQPLPAATLAPEARLLHLATYHPDLVPEALAHLRRANR